jgi:Na+/proline symporter
VGPAAGHLHAPDLSVLVAYFAVMAALSVLLARRASRSLDDYFLAGNRLPWYVLGVSNASTMFDVTGTMWLVYNLFVYGMKGIWLPWLWPTFNQVFLMVYLSAWVRRSNVLTGAEWITSRFGEGRGAELSRLSVVGFALVSVVGFIAYEFQGMGKFTAEFLPWELSANAYGMLAMTLMLGYVLLGGMISVVLTDIAQFGIMALCSLAIGVVAVRQVTGEQLAAAVPAGWADPFFGWRLELDWSRHIPALQENIAADGYSLFGLFFMAMLFKGLLVSIAGPAPNFDMQRILAAKSPREASLMSGLVSIVLLPRWWMIGGITVLALHSLGPGFRAVSSADFERVLPWVVRERVPSGLLGLVLAGLLADFMSTFSATINAGGAYLVNDLYKRYLRREASQAHYVAAGWIGQVGILALGIFFGCQAGSINQVTQWIVSGLWGGYTAPNILKWHWWRLNGFGYFWGMAAGIVASLALPKLAPEMHPLDAFPFIFLASLAASVAGSLLTEREPDAVLKRFYRQVRPWGRWGPIRDAVLAEDPSFQPNRGAVRDAVNVAVGLAWQMTLVTLPLYMVLRDMRGLWLSLGALLATSWFLKVSWLDRLEPPEGAGAVT